MFSKTYLDIAIKVISGKANDSEKKELKIWLESSEKNTRFFDELSNIWKLSEPEDIPEFPDIENEWKLLCNNIDNYDQSKINSKVGMVPGETRLLSSKIVRPALTGVFAFCVVLIAAMVFLFNQKNSVIWHSVSTLNKEQKQVILPDGSTIQLNNKSCLSYPSSFENGKREVILTGEAFFSVAKNKNKPFIVLTQNAKTTVLGTKFNVCARNEKTEVIVKEGLVNLSPLKSNGKGINIAKNELSYVSSDEKIHPLQKVNSEYRLGWLNGKLVFKNTPLSEVLNELKRHYDIPVKLETKELEKLGLSGSFNSDTIENVLSMICLSSNLKYKKYDDGFIIKKK